MTSSRWGSEWSRGSRNSEWNKREIEKNTLKKMVKKRDKEERNRNIVIKGIES